LALHLVVLFSNSSESGLCWLSALLLNSLQSIALTFAAVCSIFSLQLTGYRITLTLYPGPRLPTKKKSQLWSQRLHPMTVTSKNIGAQRAVTPGTFFYISPTFWSPFPHANRFPVFKNFD